MSILDKAVETQLKNIQARTGKTLPELYEVIRASGLNKHGQIRDMLKSELGMGHGDANTLVHLWFQTERSVAKPALSGLPSEPLDEIYSGGKAHLRPIHEALMTQISQFGPFEIAPKKGYVSLRRKKQFATIGPATKSRVEVGLNAKGLEAAERLVALPPGRMCQYRVDVTRIEEVDSELLDWIRRAFDAAG